LFFGWAGENLTMRMRMSVFTNMMRQDASFFDDPLHSTGKICTRLATDAPNVKQVRRHAGVHSVRDAQATSFRVAGGISAVLSMVLGIGIGVYYGWKLALVTLAICPFMALAMGVRMKYREQGAHQDAELFEDAGKASVGALANIHMATSRRLSKRSKTFARCNF
jgi:ABC-type multidrug transport system fused ATPase/permease subunit